MSDIIARGMADQATKKAEGIEKNVVEVNRQLAETATKLNGKSFAERKPRFTIHDDDGKKNFMTKIKPVLDARGLKCSVAINAGYIGQSDFMSWADVEQLHTEGYEILNHGWKGTPPHQLTLEQLQANYELEKAAFLAHGIDTYDYYVYSGMQPWTDTELKNKLQKVYKCSFANSDATDSNIPFDAYAVKRVGVSLNSINKAYVDRSIEKNGYLVIFGHSWDENYTVQKLEETLDYIASKNVTYINSVEAVDSFANSIELGNNGGDYFFVDKNGNVDFSYKGRSVLELFERKTIFKDAYFTNQPITQYQSNAVTHEPITYAEAVKVGLPEAGTIETLRLVNTKFFNGTEMFNYQKYVKLNTSDTYIRHWNATASSWGTFTALSGGGSGVANSNTIFSNDFFANNPITSFTSNKVTIQVITNSIALSLGLPDAGTVETVRIVNSNFLSGADAVNYQRYTCIANQEVWVRHWSSTTNGWTSFHPVGNIARTTSLRPKPSYIGATLFDTTLGKAIWCKQFGYLETKTKARNTTYALGDIILHSTKYLFRCTQTGTTGATEPNWGSSPVVDGTVLWEAYGVRQIWVDYAGAEV